MEFLLRHRDLSFDCNRGALVIFARKTWDIPTFEHHANLAIEFLDGIPKHAREHHG